MMKVSLSLSQLSTFNTKKKTSSESTSTVYHTNSRETPVAVQNSFNYLFPGVEKGIGGEIV